jgi:DNA-binding CsgD family transcriptional regulator
LSATSSAGLVGRAEELGAIEQLLDDLGQGHAAALELVGEPGIGKTRLLAELAGRAEERGYLVLSGSASELESDLPFWVLVDALDEYVQGLEPDRLAALDDETRAELKQVLPSFPAATIARDAPLQHERYRAYRAVRALLERLASTRPLVLVLDDLHWADPGSVELVGALLHRPPAAPVLVALAMRPRQVPGRLATALERALRAGELTRLELGGLTLADVQQLVGQDGELGRAETLYEESGGNPFYLDELTRSLARASDPRRPDGSTLLEGTEVPATVAAALAEELSLVTDDARALLEGAAVAGDPFELELAAAGAAMDERSALEALDELLRFDLVRLTEVPRRFRFRHPLVRRAVYDASAGGWRLAAHERCAELLATRGASAVARAHHVERSAAHGDLAAIGLLREAGDAAAHRTPESAARWYAAALRLLPERDPTETRVELLHARAAALSAAGLYVASHEALLEGIRSAPAGSALRARLTVTCARLEHHLGRHGDARARLERALQELPDPASAEAVGLMIELAVGEIHRTHPEQSLPWAARAVEAAAAAGDPLLHTAALAVEAAGAALSGATAEAGRSRDHAAKMVDALSDEVVATRLDALAHLVWAEFYTEQFDATIRHAERALAVSRATGQRDVFASVYVLLGGALAVHGRLGEAADVLDGAVEVARLTVNARGLAWALINRSLIATAAGHLDLALATVEEAREASHGLDDGLLPVAAAQTEAAVRQEAGEPAVAAELLLTAVGGEEIRASASGWGARNFDLLTRALLAEGRRTEAERVVAAAAVRAGDVGSPMARAMAERAHAELAFHGGRFDEAAERALSAVELLREVGNVYDEARCRALAGRAFAAEGKRDRAAEELERAASAFDSFGAQRYRDEVERELRKLGRIVYRRTGHAGADGRLAALTERELELARLVVERKTNPQIAAELFLSQKTVETHLRNIFRKVGVANRVELARAVEQAERDAPAQR